MLRRKFSEPAPNFTFKLPLSQREQLKEIFGESMPLGNVIRGMITLTIKRLLEERNRASGLEVKATVESIAKELAND